MITYLIVPCFNESKRLNFTEFKTILDAGINLLFVDDGSTDDTFLLLTDFKEKNPKIDILKLSNNKGKANAVYSGFTYIKERYSFDYVGYIDADSSVQASEVKSFVANANNGGLFFYGSRIGLRRNYIGKKILSTIFNIFTRNFLAINSLDTQCGLKLFHSSIANKIFYKNFETNWLFDLEVFFRAQEINTYPFDLKTWRDISSGKFYKFKNIIVIIKDIITILKICRKVKVKK